MQQLFDYIKNYPTEYVKNSKGEYFLNNAIAFDIETTSTEVEGKKIGFMYIFSFQFEDYIYLGREWREFTQITDFLTKQFIKTPKHFIKIGVHNLSFEFQFFRGLLEWKKVFATKSRKPIYTETQDNIHFFCTYFLTGLSLAKVGEQLGIKKLIGDLDYSKIRHHKTKMIESELNYVRHDTKILIALIRREIAFNKGIHNIPITKTGYVRRLFRENTIYSERTENHYRKIIKSLKISVDEYKLAKLAFMGGFTHGNIFRIGKIYNDVGSDDLSSDYPHKIVTKTFPMSRGKKMSNPTPEQFKNLLKEYHCIFVIDLYDVEEKFIFENILSVSKCIKSKNVKTNNGRITSAKHIQIAITEIDYIMIRNFYSWDKSRETISNLYYYQKFRLPKQFVTTMLDLYEQKTLLKDVEGQEEFYLKTKENANSAYGMMVTALDREVFEFSEWEWQEPKKADLQVELTKYNNSKKRFLSYLWGVYVTAYARFELFKVILKLKGDYIYSDTDSCKYLNPEKHRRIFEKENRKIMRTLYDTSVYYNIPIQKFMPKTKEGKTKPLGIWEKEKGYKRFITLGAKRYAFETHKPINYGTKDKPLLIPYSFTVSGCNKFSAIPYLYKKYGNELLQNFNDNMYVPRGHTGKNTFTYCDDDVKGYFITDYNGLKTKVYVDYGIHLEPTDFTLNLAQQFADLLKGYKEF